MLREKGDLAEAKTIIDQATEYEKTKDKGKTWYFRGLIYATIDTTSNEQYANIAPNALQVAMESFNKAHDLDPDEKTYYVTGAMGLPTLMKQQIDGYWSYYYNKAITEYQDSDFESAVKDFENSYLIKPSDTNSYVNAAYAAHNGQMYEEAAKNYGLAIAHGAAVNNKDLYTNYIGILGAALKDIDKALAVSDEALKAFPNDPDLLKTRVNLLITGERTEAARNEMENAIAADPQNVTLYFTLGMLNDELGDKVKAEEAYKKGLAIDPNHYETNFNYGVMLINEANEIIQEVNNLGVSAADKKKAKELEPKINEKLKQALPQWEKVHELKPDDQTAIETLSYIYSSLDMKEKAKQMEALLDN